ncbi:NACHT, LRR and PYD domains-containing 3-like [Pelobates cultripes]|uniref:NACHT, LRR and PYD domains-containing protein 3 n=2 Tax=Pelobates cultripes TaxID=61616 RepID=A0AAD1S004_PELCU|nr:NACHT, LRR and PYD domains-containing 3-like [Pelobates cultripes]
MSMSSSETKNPTVLDILIRSLYNLKNSDFKRFLCKLSDFYYGDKCPIERGRLEFANQIKTARLLMDYYGEENVLEFTFQVFNGIDLRGPAEELQEERRRISASVNTKQIQHCTVWDILLRSLNNLVQEDFERFQYKLSDVHKDGICPIEFGLLEGAGHNKTAKILMDCHGEENVLGFVYQVFMTMNLRGPADNLLKERAVIDKLNKELSEKSVTDFRQNYMEEVKDQYQWMKEKNGLLGDVFNMERRYTKLLLLKKHSNEKERENEIKCSGTKHLEMMADRSLNHSMTSIEALFDPDEKGDSPKIVVLQGPAGIGKTMTAQKIMLDWASGNLYQDKFNYVFYMSSTEINQITGKMTIAGFITEICQLSCSQQVMQSILQDSEKILFLVDGFDELDQSYMIKRAAYKNYNHETTKEIFLSCLFAKRVLKKSSVVITTRPFMLEKLKDFITCDSYVEILGLKDREEYFLNFFEKKEQAVRFLALVKQNETLFTLCAVPMACWIVCTVLQQQIEEDLKVIHYNTATSVYQLYVESLLTYHKRHSDLPINNYIKRLCALAKDGVLNHKVIFKKSDISNFQLPVSNIKSLLLNENMFRRVVTPQTCYSFIHLSVQEFFAALHYLLNEETESPSIKEEIRSLLEMSENDPHLASTVKFLFGLSSVKQINEFEEIVGCKFFSGSKEMLEEWLKKRISTCQCHNDMLHYLYEIQDDDIIRRIMPQCLQLETEGLICGSVSSRDSLIDRSLSFCLEKSTSYHDITFNLHSFSQDALKMLSPRIRKISKLKFDWCQFPDADISCLFERANKIKELQFIRCNLTPLCCRYLLSTIKNRYLTKFVMTWNELQDSGAKVLCDGLRQSECKIQELRLEKCNLTSSSCEDICSVILNKCLAKLELSQNELQDSGVKYLCGGLMQSGCVLLELGLEDCNLTSICCEDFYSVFITNRSLINLDLSENKLNDSGVKLLCEGLKHPGCTIQELRLRKCDLTLSCCEDLKSVIVHNLSLKNLDLSSNDIEDLGVKHLCEGLQHPGCILQELRLDSCLLTSSCCEIFHSVLVINRSLTELDLSWNDLQDSGVKHLCDGLKNQGCVLKQLILEDCGLTSNSCEDLHSVIITNQSMTKLSLAANEFKKAGIHLLRQGLRHPNCTLQELRLSSRPINVDEYRKRKGLLQKEEILLG